MEETDKETYHSKEENRQ